MRPPVREKRWRVPKIPGLSRYPAVDAVSVEKLVIDPAVLGRPVALTVSGRITRADAPGEERIELSGRRTDGIAGTLDLSYAQGSEAPVFHAHLDDAQILPLWLGLDSSVVLDLAGSGPRQDWRGTLRAAASGVNLLDGKVQSSGEFPTVIACSLDTNIAQSRRLQALERFLGPDAHVSLEALLSKAGRLDILDFAASSARGMIQGAGTALLPEKRFTVSLHANHADLSLLACREEGTEMYLPADISVSLTGDASKLDVGLVASSMSAPLLYAEATILPGTAVRVDGLANLFTAPFTASEAARKMIGERSAIAWSANYDTPGRLLLDAFSVTYPSVAVNASGSVEFPSASANIAYTGVLRAGHIPGFADASGHDKPVDFTGTITESLTEPAVSLGAKNIDFAAYGLSIRQGTLDLGFHLERHGVKRSIRDGMARLESPQCSYGGGPGLAVSCTAPFESNGFDDILFRDIAVSVPILGAKLTADMDYGRDTGKASLRGHVNFDELAATSAVYPHPFGGALSASLRIERGNKPESLQIGAAGDWFHPTGLPEAAMRMAGDKVHAAVRLESGQDRIRIEDARLELEVGTITGSGWQNKADRRFRLLLDTEAIDLAKRSEEHTSELQSLA